MLIVNNNHLVDIDQLLQHPLHKECFLDPSEKNKKEHYHESIEKFGKIKPVVYVENEGQKLVIDGWGFVQYAKDSGIDQVSAKCVAVTDNEDILQVMLELQFSDHNTPKQEYQLYKAAYRVLSKGKGYRSDLNEDEETESPENKRRENTYQKIAAMTGASSGKRVQYMLKIGDTNPLYFERMELDRMSLNSAYLNCKSEEKGEAPSAPKVKAPVFMTSETDPPDFNTSSQTPEPEFTTTNQTELPHFTTTTEDSAPGEFDGTMVAQTSKGFSGISGTQPPEQTRSSESKSSHQSVADGEPRWITMEGICADCNLKTTVKINLADLLKFKEWNTLNLQ
ncbi:ParB/RepB/Spo0J family partition protein [Taibaiella soli]|uniref:ParB/Sulfiredoxin domain-containing protein n=1 Tax=Taibaiella soli TaxID=1649169 RepID=A0A2W2B8G4_9BACT|nr:ParB/RepB/Spo0J family partition protein [Taibaiella soli]PZF72579.1 hypothetical protein DN068_11990 [Taibaiella soli]